MTIEARLNRADGALTTLSNGRHVWNADVGKMLGSGDRAPDPHDLLDSALAACTTLTLELYIRRKQLTETALHVTVDHVESKTAEGAVHYPLQRSIHIDGEGRAPMTASACSTSRANAPSTACWKAKSPSPRHWSENHPAFRLRHHAATALTAMTQPPSSSSAPSPMAPMLDRIAAKSSELAEGLTIRRSLPTRQRRMIGAWCFLDHIGPVTFAPGHEMHVGAHPHTGLQTFTWMIEGEILHRDSLGSEQVIRPGQVNLMMAGHGISHTEDSLTHGQRLHAAQLWIALPKSEAHRAPAFDH